MAGVHSRARSFDRAADSYERGRPGWPPEAVEIAARRLGLDGDAAVLDLAAGTGKLTRVLAGRFATVTAVEPLDGMRAVLYNRLDWQDQSVPWRKAADEACGRHWLPHGDVDPQDETAWRAALATLGTVAEDAVEHVQRLDAAGIEALYSSFSRLAGLPPDRRAAALADIRAVIRRHGVTEAEFTYRTEITTVTRCRAGAVTRTAPVG